MIVRLLSSGSLLAALVVLTVLSNPVAAQPTTDDLITIACGAPGIPASISPPDRQAAANAVSNIWVALEAFPETRVPNSLLWDLNSGISKRASSPSATPECRQAPVRAQVSRIFSTGDPIVGKPLAGATQAAYIGLVNPEGNRTLERRKARAEAVLLNLRNSIVGSGARGIGNVRARLEGCAGGGPLGVAGINCANVAWRQVATDLFLPGFYVGFRSNPLLNLGCDYLADRADLPDKKGGTVEWRYAASRALVSDSKCAGVRASSSEYETAATRVAAIDLFNSGTSSAALAAQAVDPAASHGDRLAAALALGFRLELAAVIDENTGNPVVNNAAVAKALGLANPIDLRKLGLLAFDVELGQAVAAPCTRAFLGSTTALLLSVSDRGLPLQFTVNATGDNRVF